MTAEEIVQTVGPAQSWGEATVKTLINRLLKKKALASERSGGRAVYRPIVTRRTISPARARACWTGCSTARSPRWSPTTRATGRCRRTN
jgi:predicted transcriptional regulator